MIEVVGKVSPTKFSTVCTDKSCRAILHFNYDDIKYNLTEGLDPVLGIACPLCKQLLKVEDFTVIPDE